MEVTRVQRQTQRPTLGTKYLAGNNTCDRKGEGASWAAGGGMLQSSPQLPRRILDHTSVSVVPLWVEGWTLYFCLTQDTQCLSVMVNFVST